MSLTRAFICVTVMLAVACPACLCSAADSAANERPNVILIYADDLAFGDLSCYGSATIATPNIDRLATEGIRLPMHIAQRRLAHLRVMQC